MGRLAPDEDATHSFDLPSLLASTEGVAPLGEDRWVCDVGEGRNVEILVAEGGLVFRGARDPRRVLDAEHGGWLEDDDVDAPMYEAIESLARPLQRVTRWTLVLGGGDDEVAPDVTCGRCGHACFEWELTCPRCGVDVDPVPVKPPPDDDDRIAKRFLDALLRGGHVEIDPRRRSAILSVLAATFARSAPPEQLMSDLVDHTGVLEVYCDDELPIDTARRARASARRSVRRAAEA